ncbi:MAG: hypothetical protein LBQ89_00650 [Treponema sp.]|nr:hypothetical protein [Treponema sp.]
MANFEIGAISEDRMWYYDKMCIKEKPEPVYETGNSKNLNVSALVQHKTHG